MSVASGDLVLRVFIDPPADGVTNMAIDECLLAATAGGGAATLRLYRWSPPTLSLGCFQKLADPGRADPALAELPVVRRITGGGAIVHADELTYSLLLPAGHALAGERPADLYTWMHQRLAEALAALGGRTRFQGGDKVLTGRAGPFLCFESHAPYDLMIGGAKLAGSAQRRTRRGVLQHGSLVLNRTHRVQPSASVAEHLGRPVTFDEVAAAVLAAIAATGVALGEAVPSRVDDDALREFRAKHADRAWVGRW
ncbi:MAG: lipoate--protein ligase family protein [Planctomycetes bacterium]|nr:lipoate--protein ligase family protein [Planctomycetota bacterium]